MTRPWLVSITSVFCASTGRQSAAPGPVARAAVAEAAISAAARIGVPALLRSMPELGEQTALDPGGDEGRDIAAHLRDFLYQPGRNRLVDRVCHKEDGLEFAVQLLV